jgi:uncharacterized protein YkwD
VPDTLPDLQLPVQQLTARRYGVSRAAARRRHRRLATVLLGVVVLGLLAVGVPTVARARGGQSVRLEAASSAHVDPGPLVRPHQTDVVVMGVDGVPPPPPPAPTPTATPTATTPAAKAAAAAVASRTAQTAAPVAAAAPADPSVEGQVLALTNQERAKAGCGPLTADSRLATLARAFSADMRARNFFSHTNPDGLDPFQRAEAAGISNMRAENIAMGQPDPASVMTAWMNSPGHRANILNCSLRTLGVGVATGAGGPWWTQDFGV